MGAFDKAFNLILESEGGVSNHPRDPGGLTKYGITSRDYPSLDILNLTEDQAKRIYRDDYWDRILGDFLPPVVAILVFDCAVNQGVHRAIKFLQRAVNVRVDGVLGPVTLKAAQDMDPVKFAAEFAAERALHYASLSTFDIFGRGWMRRLMNTTNRVLHGLEAE